MMLERGPNRLLSRWDPYPTVHLSKNYISPPPLDLTSRLRSHDWLVTAKKSHYPEATWAKAAYHRDAHPVVKATHAPASKLGSCRKYYLSRASGLYPPAEHIYFAMVSPGRQAARTSEINIVWGGAASPERSSYVGRIFLFVVWIILRLAD